jgi:hypothetical protein
LLRNKKNMYEASYLLLLVFGFVILALYARRSRFPNVCGMPDKTLQLCRPDQLMNAFIPATVLHPATFKHSRHDERSTARSFAMLRRPDRGVAWLAATMLTVLSPPGARCGVSEPSSNHAQAHENGRGERVNSVLVRHMHATCMQFGHACTLRIPLVQQSAVGHAAVSMFRWMVEHLQPHSGASSNSKT